MSEPVDKSLWRRAQSAAKRKYTKHPSAYSNSYAVKWYKEKGGKFKGEKDDDKGLGRWHREEWKDSKGKDCGRKSAKDGKKYPYCRPSKKASEKTPKTWGEMTDSEKKRKISEKRKLEKSKKQTKQTNKVKPLNKNSKSNKKGKK